MLAADFSARFPRLFHMAEAAAWPLIQKHGLLSTQALLDLFEVQGAERERIERRQRPSFIEITHPEHGSALVRDQRPMSDATLAPVLGDGLVPADWYALLNARVFFYVDEEKLNKLRKTYDTRPNIVLVLDTARVLEDFAPKITLSPINSGYSRSMFGHSPAQRGLGTFQRLADFDRAPSSIVECAVDYALPDVEKYLLEKRG